MVPAGRSTVSRPPAEERYPDWAPADNLVDIVLGRGTNGSPASLGVLTVEFVDAMYRAAKEGRTMQIGAERGVMTRRDHQPGSKPSPCAMRNRTTTARPAM